MKATGEPDPHAIEAAKVGAGRTAIPDFGSDRDPDMTDFNDMLILDGAEAVARAIANATAPAPARGERQPGDDNAPAGDSEGNGWPDPHLLAAKIEPEAYPLDALPDNIRAAVEEVAGFVKAPAALSLACQAHIDAKRAEKLHGPVSLFLLTIADSGERKSTCDGFFTSAIRQYQEEQAEAMKPAIKEYQAAIAAWEAERDGFLSAVKDAGKKGNPTDKLRGDLAQLQQEKPEPPRVPRLILGDETPENLAWGLAKQWPSAGVLSSESGVVFGSHGMGKDSAMRNLALLNVLWDGGAHSIGQRTSESFTVRGARLTMGLMIQETTLREYFSKSGGLARGTGFLARFLVAWPESTQGQRPFTEAPANWPHLAAFHRRIAAIMNQPAPIDEDGALTPAAMLSLAPDAKAAWVEYHDAIESQLASGGENADLREFMEGTPEEIAERQRDAAVDLAATQKAAAILRKGGPNAYAKARRALIQESRDWWDEHVEEESYPATAEGLAEFIRDSLEPICYSMVKEAEFTPAIKAKTLGEGLRAHLLEKLNRYETHLDRKFERTLAMLLKLKDLRGA